jgi:hypothetical protein
MRIAINYRLTGHGWSECLISSDEASCTTTASYLSDALGNLVRAAEALLSGFSAVSFSFEEEPGEYRWVIRSPRLNEIDVVILQFPDLYSGRPDHEGQEIFRVRCTPETFAEAVYEAALRVLKEHGEEGYAEKWSEHQFPVHQFESLRGHLDRLGHAV